jgi:hypothetical protein
MCTNVNQSFACATFEDPSFSYDAFDGILGFGWENLAMFPPPGLTQVDKKNFLNKIRILVGKLLTLIMLRSLTTTPCARTKRSAFTLPAKTALLKQLVK